jgi:hypothetical protein
MFENFVRKLKQFPKYAFSHASKDCMGSKMTGICIYEAYEGSCIAREAIISLGRPTF